MKIVADSANELKLPLRGLRIIHAECEAGYPDESCGFLFGRETGNRRVVTAVKPVDNKQTDNRIRRFLITPQQFRNAEEYARQIGQVLLGFYHSHPDHPAIPSEFDRDHALPFYSYLIVSVQKGKTADIRSWLLADDRNKYNEERIELENHESAHSNTDRTPKICR